MKIPVSLSGLVLVAALLGCLVSPGARAEVTLLNVSYDPTREFYDAYNQEFAQHWKKPVSYTHLTLPTSDLV